MRYRLMNIFLLVVFCLTLSACGGEVETEDTTEISSSNEEASETTVSADIDITSFSGTMAYAEVSNMLASPDDYVGKIVRMDGQFATYEENGMTYPLCIVEDATACCSIGMEFVLEGENTYPDDYPETFSDITITGEFQTYEKDGEVYCNLVNAVIE